jgi:hypothetical protein
MLKINKAISYIFLQIFHIYAVLFFQVCENSQFPRRNITSMSYTCNNIYMTPDTTLKKAKDIKIQQTPNI